MEYVTKYATFLYSAGAWQMNVWDCIPIGCGKVFTLRVEVPTELIPPELPGEVIVEEARDA